MADQPTGDDSSFLPNWISPLFENPWITVGALIAAVVIWFYIRGKVEGELRMTAELDLRVNKEENQQYIITDVERNAVEIKNELDIRLRGARSQVQRIKNQNLLIISKTISVEDEDLNEPMEVKITDKDLELKKGDVPFGVRLADNQSLTLRVTVQKFVKKNRTISGENLQEDIERFTVNEPADGYRIVDLVPQFDSVTIQGPEQMVAEAHIEPETRIDVAGQASNITRQVPLTTDPPSRHLSLSVQTMAITVKIDSELTEKEIEKQFQIATGPTLSGYLEQREWNIEPANRTVTITFELPQSVVKQFTPDNIHAILILPQEEVQNLSDPTTPSAVSTDEFLRIIVDQSIPSRDRVNVVKIEPERIKFVAMEDDDE